MPAQPPSLTLTSLGHATFLLTTTRGSRLMLDPYASGCLGGAMAYSPLTHEADAVMCSHAHVDHAAVDDVPGTPTRLEGAEVVWRDVRIWRHAVGHDEYGGRRRGGMVDMLEVEADGWRILHGADVGESPSVEVLSQLMARGEYDVVLLPTGGFYTIGAAQAWEWWRRLGARWMIPAHFKTPWCHLPIRGVEALLSRGEDTLSTRWPEATLRFDALPHTPVIVMPCWDAQMAAESE